MRLVLDAEADRLTYVHLKCAVVQSITQHKFIHKVDKCCYSMSGLRVNSRLLAIESHIKT